MRLLLLTSHQATTGRGDTHPLNETKDSNVLGVFAKPPRPIGHTFPRGAVPPVAPDKAAQA